jgi:hypothetical protein
VSDWRAWLADPATPDDRLVAGASAADAEPDLLAALAGDAERMRRCPALATAIFGNPRASMTLANRALLTCARAGVTPPDVPGFEELVADIQADAERVDPATRDRGFAELLVTASSADTSEPEPEPPAPAASASAAPAVAPPPPGLRRRAVIDFTKLKLYEKVRLATLGNANCRQTLLRDPNRMVALAAIRSPQITDGEVAKAAGNRALSEDVIRYIANRKELVKLYAVKLALVGNPKCALAVTLRLLPTLHLEDIKQLARSKNIPGALAIAAKKLAAARGPQ